MFDILRSFNDQEGRFNRFKYWIYTFVMQVLLVLLSVVIIYGSNLLQINVLVVVTSFLIPLGMIYIGFTGSIKRLHDLDKSGWRHYYY